MQKPEDLEYSGSSHEGGWDSMGTREGKFFLNGRIAAGEYLN